MNEGAYREAPPPTRDEFDVLVGRVWNLEQKPKKVVASKHWTRRKHFVTRLVAVPIMVVGYGLIWDGVPVHETGRFVAFSVLVGMVTLALVIAAGVVCPGEFTRQTWDEIPYPDGF